MKLHIEVTQDDIDRGIPRSNCRCPIALAVKRTTKWRAFDVGSTYFYRKYKITILPESARQFIDRFDDRGNHIPVKPFSFDIEIPDK